MKALNLQKMGSARQSGFTIIELVVVILLLGILTATALPRFIDVSDEAHNAVVDAVEGGLVTAFALYHAEFVAENDGDTSVGSFSPSASATTGYPDLTSNAVCASVATGVLQGGAPTISVGVQTPASAGAISTDLTAATDPTTGDFIAYLMTGDNSCTYLYHTDEGDKTNVTGAKYINITNTGAISRGTL